MFVKRFIYDDVLNMKRSFELGVLEGFRMIQRDSYGRHCNPLARRKYCLLMTIYIFILSLKLRGGGAV